MVSPGSWVLRFEKGESERGIHPSIRASNHIPHPNHKPGAEREQGGGEVGGEEDREERNTERERERVSSYENAGNVKVTSVRV